jgi:uncharacterized protein
MSAIQLSNQKTISLETYKKNGDPVRSPVWVVQENGMLYIRSDPKSWKVRRLRNNQNVRLARCTMSGKVRGEWFKGEARFVDIKEGKKVLGLFNKKYGLMIKALNLYNRLRGRTVVVIGITI